MIHIDIREREPPSGAKDAIASSYGWGSVPMMTVYWADMAGEDGQGWSLCWFGAVRSDLRSRGGQSRRMFIIASAAAQ